MLKRLLSPRWFYRYERYIKARSMMWRFGIDNPTYAREMGYWTKQYRRDGGRFENSWYRGLMLDIAGETDESFVAGKTIVDFGCGPRGSLCWAGNARRRIGIDVMATKYREAFGLDAQPMEYVTSSEISIPLPDASIDVLFTMNALDHTAHFEIMCAELLRILAPGGLFVASLNLNEPVTVAEPQTLSDELIDAQLLRRLTIETRRDAPQGPTHDTYVHCRAGTQVHDPSAPRYVWIRARKPK